MMKKVFKILPIVFAVLFIFSGQSAYSDVISNTNSGTISSVGADKVWTLTFNRNVDMNTAKDSIKVYESDSGKEVSVNISAAGKSEVKVSPVGLYEDGKVYVLTVDSSLKDTYGNNLTNASKYNFKINNLYSSIINIGNYNDYYNAVKYALENYKDEIVLNIAFYDKNTYKLAVIDKILDDYPNLRAGYKGATSVIQYSNPVKVTIDFKYNADRDSLIEKNNTVNNKVSEIVNNVTAPYMNDYDKELALHDYVVNHARYDSRFGNGNMPDDSYSAYGVLINGTGVCQGYSDAMYRLLTTAGIENTMVIGEANNGTGWISHTWNIVKIQGKYYNLDTTWDDPVTSNGSSILSHSYFNVTDAQLSKDHKWDKLQYPNCTSTDYNYKK